MINSLFNYKPNWAKTFKIYLASISKNTPFFYLHSKPQYFTLC